MTKELEITFTKKGANFTQIERSEFGYIYRVELDGHTHFEVFKHKETNLYDFATKTALEDKKVSYPKDESFGVWAWCVTNLDTAKDVLKDFKPLTNDPQNQKTQAV